MTDTDLHITWKDCNDCSKVREICDDVEGVKTEMNNIIKAVSAGTIKQLAIIILGLIAFIAINVFVPRSGTSEIVSELRSLKAEISITKGP